MFRNWSSESDKEQSVKILTSLEKVTLAQNLFSNSSAIFGKTGRKNKPFLHF